MTFLIFGGNTETPVHKTPLWVFEFGCFFQYCDTVGLSCSVFSSVFSSPVLSSTYWSALMAVLWAGEAPQPVRYEDSRLAGVRRLEAGSGRFPGMCVFPHSGAITVQRSSCFCPLSVCTVAPCSDLVEQGEDEHTWEVQ